MTKQNITIMLASPRGFCAGVTRAIEIVEKAIEKFGAPVYVRHEIVHNAHVVKELEKKGAVFVQETAEVPEGKIIIFSAHGVPLSVLEETKLRNLRSLDATCPLVEKVHHEVKRHFTEGRKIILIGHAGHPEVIGTVGQLPDGAISVIEDASELNKIKSALGKGEKIACVTQTTLSVDETAEVVGTLKKDLPNVLMPKSNDICYATTNRQQAVKEMAGFVDALLVIGSPNSSNSRRLVEVAKKAGCAKAILIQDVTEINWNEIAALRTLGITAGASAPERLVNEVIEACKSHFAITIKEIKTCEEKVRFKLPEILE